MIASAYAMVKQQVLNRHFLLSLHYLIKFVDLNLKPILFKNYGNFLHGYNDPASLSPGCPNFHLADHCISALAIQR